MSGAVVIPESSQPVSGIEVAPGVWHTLAIRAPSDLAKVTIGSRVKADGTPLVNAYCRWYENTLDPCGMTGISYAAASAPMRRSSVRPPHQ